MSLPPLSVKTTTPALGHSDARFRVDPVAEIFEQPLSSRQGQPVTPLLSPLVAGKAPSTSLPSPGF
jgi:hypothetical protein